MFVRETLRRIWRSLNPHNKMHPVTYPFHALKGDRVTTKNGDTVLFNEDKFFETEEQLKAFMQLAHKED